MDADDLVTVLSSIGTLNPDGSPNFVPIEETLTEAEATAIEGAFAAAMGRHIESSCSQCTYRPCWCVLTPDDIDPFSEIDGNDGQDEVDTDGDGNPDPPEGGTPPGGGGGPNPNGDDDGDGIPNKHDCDSPAFTGSSKPGCTDPCGDTNGDGTKNQDDCDSPECYEGDPEDCECDNCSAEIEILSVERFPGIIEPDDLNYLPPHHLVTVRVSAGDCDGSDSHTAAWEIESPPGMQVFQSEASDGHTLQFRIDQGEGSMSIVATIECNGQTWTDAIDLTVEDYDVVDLRYKTWLPTDVLGWPVDLITGLPVGAFGGDGANRPPDPHRTHYRTWQHAIFDLNPQTTTPILSGPDRDFGHSSAYWQWDVHKDPLVIASWGFTPNIGAVPFAGTTLPVTNANSNITQQSTVFSHNGLVYTGRTISYELAAGFPLIPGSPKITAHVALDAFQEYSLLAGKGDLWIKLIDDYDLFPMHGMWLNGDRMLWHNPLGSVPPKTPLELSLLRGHYKAPAGAALFQTISARVPRP